MGVYSSVAIASTKEGYERIIARAAELAAMRGVKHPLVGKDPDGLEYGFEVFEERGGCVAFGWKCVKFAGYEGWGDVMAVRDAIKDARGEGYPVEVAIAVDETGYSEKPEYEEALALHVDVSLETVIY